MNRRLGVLISGRGSNLQSLIDAIGSGRLNATIAVVISNVEDAGGLERARAAGIESLVVSHRGWSTREDYDAALVRELQGRSVGLVCLANRGTYSGWMMRPGRWPALSDRVIAEAG